MKSNPELGDELVIERTFNASIDKVWRAITDKAAMKQWYFDLADFKPEVGFAFRFSGGDKCNEYVHLCEVTEVIPGRKLAYSWGYEGYEGASVLSFELFDEGDKTRLILIHTGLETFPQDNPAFAKSSFAGGWANIIGEKLKAFLETA